MFLYTFTLPSVKYYFFLISFSKRTASLFVNYTPENVLVKSCIVFLSLSKAFLFILVDALQTDANAYLFHLNFIFFLHCIERVFIVLQNKLRIEIQFSSLYFKTSSALDIALLDSFSELLIFQILFLFFFRCEKL